MTEESFRRTGRTHRMVEQVPNSGAIIIVSNQGMKRYINEMLQRVKGEEVAKKCTILVTIDMDDTHRLFGRNEPIYVDHEFWSNPHIKSAVKDRVSELQLRWSSRLAEKMNP